MNNNPRHMIAFQNARAQVIGPLIGGDGMFQVRLPIIVAHALIQTGVSGSGPAEEGRIAAAAWLGDGMRIVKLRMPSMDQARLTATLAIALLTVAYVEQESRRAGPPVTAFVQAHAAAAYDLLKTLKPGGSMLANAARLVTLIERAARTWRDDSGEIEGGAA